MSVKNFRFVSPGVFVNEIDNSQLPASPAGIGPVVIGRAEKGPGLRPTTVNSFSEFVEVFGAPSAGNASGDVWRKGQWNTSAPTYGVYAAQAYLRNSSPLTYIRLLGNEAAEGASGAGVAGWDGGTNGKAWGLCVFEANGASTLNGVLAGIIYTSTSNCTVQLSGAVVANVSGTVPTASVRMMSGSNLIVADTGVAKEFKIIINNSDGDAVQKTSAVNFDVNSSKYIRKVLNTTPQRINSDLIVNEANYFLGETFDRHLAANISAAGGSTFAAILNLNEDTEGDADNFRKPLQSAQSCPVIACDAEQRTSGSSNSYRVQNMAELFRFHALDQPGDWSNRNIKISIEDIKASTNDSDPYGSFSVKIRHLSDSDNVVRVLEQFSDCNLNPNSLNYIARKIGDKYSEWNNTERRYVANGDYDNSSKYVRVAVNEEVVGDNANLLPFGWKGMVKWKDESGIGGGGGTLYANSRRGNWVTSSVASGIGRPVPTVVDSARLSRGVAGAVGLRVGPMLLTTGSNNLTASIAYPVPEMRLTASDGDLSNPTDAYFGYQTTRTAGGTVFDGSNIDLLRPRGAMVANMFSVASTSYAERSIYFTLDDIRQNQGSPYVRWVSGSHMDGTSLTCVSGAITGVLDQGYDRFTVPMYGGFDGLDITELDPFRNTGFPANPSDTNSYTFKSIRQAIDAISDPEVVEMNLATIPGLKQEGLTTNLINVCEDRADALAVIDLDGGYRPRAEAQTSARNNTTSQMDSMLTSLRRRALNTSYGCTFYPWLRARDTINGSMVWVPPSVAALGTFSSSQKKTQVWFAPAGFNRGGLTEGAAGIPIVDVAHQLRRKDRDKLYTANVNPIAKFPAEGIVIFGQKTLQVTPSALDRINVRRLMIFVKKRISQVASQLLFDPNVQTTWNRFISAVQPILSDIKTNFGLSDFKLVLDESTTTPDLIDRNIMYARIFLKPTRAIEYIAIDFNITRTGASFDD